METFPVFYVVFNRFPSDFFISFNCNRKVNVLCDWRRLRSSAEGVAVINVIRYTISIVSVNSGGYELQHPYNVR